ncbi:hypothetical protein GmHk_06G017005 [Glycine max]|nr:hypothetical protein GmHk_06G017005 [Glycine max]
MCGDLGHVAPLPPKKPSKSVISSSIRASSASSGDPVGPSPAWASGQSPGHATSALNCSGVGHTKGVKPCPC